MSRILSLIFLLVGAAAVATVPLTVDQLSATFSGPNKKIDAASYNTAKVWKYVREVPKSDYTGLEVCWGYVPYVYRTGDDRYDHVHVSTRTENVFLIVVVNVASGAIVGHCLLDLNAEYGLGPPQQLSRKCG